MFITSAVSEKCLAASTSLDTPADGPSIRHFTQHWRRNRDYSIGVDDFDNDGESTETWTLSD